MTHTNTGTRFGQENGNRLFVPLFPPLCVCVCQMTYLLKIAAGPPHTLRALPRWQATLIPEEHIIMMIFSSELCYDLSVGSGAIARLSRKYLPT